jgi:hypothetical protein
MKFQIEDAIPLLERTPRTLRVMLEGLPPTWIENNEGDKTWSPFNVLGHLIHGERTDWIPRARLILEKGETVTFTPFDRFAQMRESRGKALSDLLAEFERLRDENVDALRGMRLTPNDLERTGMHPELGRVTLGQLLATWVAHDMDHVVQIARTMAKQYQGAVGPWREYLSVVK